MISRFWLATQRQISNSISLRFHRLAHSLFPSLYLRPCAPSFLFLPSLFFTYNITMLHIYTHKYTPNYISTLDTNDIFLAPASLDEVQTQDGAESKKCGGKLKKKMGYYEQWAQALASACGFILLIGLVCCCLSSKPRPHGTDSTSTGACSCDGGYFGVQAYSFHSKFLHGSRFLRNSLCGCYWLG